MFNRELGNDFVNELIKLVEHYMELKITHDDVVFAVKLFNQVEEKIDGRIAGDVEDYIFNYFLRKHAAAKFSGIDHINVEIGVLFGGSFIFTLKAVEKDSVKFIGIDPLDGYYIKDEKIGSKIDKYSQHEVNRQTLENNIQKNEIDISKYEIYQGYSTDQKILDQLKSKKISVLFIDGDHTYNGVKFDLLEYSKYVINGGYIIIDNYNDFSWPEVKQYCDEYLSSHDSIFGRHLIFGRSLIIEKGVSTSVADRFQFSSGKRFAEKISKLKEKNAELEQNLKITTSQNKELEIFKKKCLSFEQNPFKIFFKQILGLKQ